VLYNIHRDKIYVLKVEDVNTHSVTIRFNETRNSQINHVRNEEDYIIDNVIMIG
jgi:hypothetical protein